jgi:hypothetical protein
MLLRRRVIPYNNTWFNCICRSIDVVGYNSPFIPLACIRTRVASTIRSGGNYFGALTQTKQFHSVAWRVFLVCHNSCNAAFLYCYFILVLKLYTPSGIYNSPGPMRLFFLCTSLNSFLAVIDSLLCINLCQSYEQCIQLQKITPSTTCFFLFLSLLYKGRFVLVIRTV